MKLQAGDYVKYYIKYRTEVRYGCIESVTELGIFLINNQFIPEFDVIGKVSEDEYLIWKLSN